MKFLALIITVLLLGACGDSGSGGRVLPNGQVDPNQCIGSNLLDSKFQDSDSVVSFNSNCEYFATRYVGGNVCNERGSFIDLNTTSYKGVVKLKVLETDCSGLTVNQEDEFYYEVLGKGVVALFQKN